MPLSDLGESFIVVSGNIGAGKSTLVGRLASSAGSRGFLERHESNAYLAPFYREPARWAFHVQAGFLALSLEDHDAVASAGRRGVLERTLDEHQDVFAVQLHEEGVLSENEFGVLKSLHRSASARPATAPDLLIYLQAPAEELIGRIRARGRAAESGLDPDYVRALNRRYEHFAEGWSSCPLVVVDTTLVDVREDDGLNEVGSRCLTALQGSR